MTIIIKASDFVAAARALESCALEITNSDQCFEMLDYSTLITYNEHGQVIIINNDEEKKFIA